MQLILLKILTINPAKKKMERKRKNPTCSGDGKMHADYREKLTVEK